MAKKILYNEDAQKALQNGVNTVAECVKVTLGAKGNFVGLDRDYGSPLITNDGVTIAKEVVLSDEFENMGAKLVCEASSKTNSDSGDGTTTAIVLAQALVNNGLGCVANGVSPVLIKKGMEQAVDNVVEYIKEHAIPVRGADDIAKIATISSRDEQFGKIIADIIEKMGNDVVITVEESHTGNTEYEIVKGLQFDKGYVAPHMVTDVEKMICEYDNPLILITDQKITNIQDILPILEEVSKSGRALLIISDEMSNEVMGTLIQNKLRGVLNVVCVKPPKFGEMREAWLEDIATLTGGVFINSKHGMALKDIETHHLGSAQKIKVDKDTTTIIGGTNNPDIIQNRVSSIRAELEKATSEFDKEKLKERIAKLTGGVAVIRVGASTEVEMKDKKLRLEDALAATRAAIDEGIVPGGGIALLNACDELQRNKIYDYAEDYLAGNEIVIKALQEPFKNIVENAGCDYKELYSTYMANKGKKPHCYIKNCGFDVMTNNFVDMIENGIIDPAKVTRTALQNALSVATMIISTKVLIAEDKETKEEKRI